MSEEKKYEINLTLDPTPAAPGVPAAAAAAAQTQAAAAAPQQQEEVPVEKLDIDSWPPPSRPSCGNSPRRST